MPLVGGTVDNHKKPNVAPNIKAFITLDGIKIKYIMDTPLNKYIALSNFFLLTLVDKYPLLKVPKTLNRPISAKIAVAVQSSKPLSLICIGI